MYSNSAELKTKNLPLNQSALPDGNCAYNVFALFIRHCFLTTPLAHPDIIRFTELLKGQFYTFTGKNGTSSHFFRMFSILPPETIQEMFAPVLRQMVVDTMQDPTTSYKKNLLDFLKMIVEYTANNSVARIGNIPETDTFIDYVTQNPYSPVRQIPEAETFLVHQFICSQLRKVEHEYPDAPGLRQYTQEEQNEIVQQQVIRQQNAIEQWWNRTGFMAYINEIKESASHAMDRARWGSSPELDALSHLFQVKLVVAWGERGNYELGLHGDPTCRTAKLSISGDHWLYSGQIVQIIKPKVAIESTTVNELAITKPRIKVDSEVLNPILEQEKPSQLPRSSVKHEEVALLNVPSNLPIDELLIAASEKGEITAVEEALKQAEAFIRTDSNGEKRLVNSGGVPIALPLSDAEVKYFDRMYAIASVLRNYYSPQKKTVRFKPELIEEQTIVENVSDNTPSILRLTSIDESNLESAVVPKLQKAYLTKQRKEAVSHSNANPGNFQPKWLRKQTLTAKKLQVNSKPVIVQETQSTINEAKPVRPTLMSNFEPIFEKISQKYRSLLLKDLGLNENLINYLDEKGWINKKIAELMMSHAPSSYKLSNAFERLRLEADDLPPALGQACIFAMLHQTTENLGWAAYTLVHLKNAGFIPTLEKAMPWLSLVATHPNVYVLYNLFENNRLDHIDNLPDPTNVLQNTDVMKRLKAHDPELKCVEPEEHSFGPKGELYKAITLDFGLKGINTSAIQELAYALSSNKTVQKFHLFSHHLTHRDLQAIADMLCLNTTLQELQLTFCDIDAKGATILAEGLQKNTTLQSLDLCGNPINDAGAKAIAIATTTSGLTKLRFTNCKVGDAGVIAVSQLFQSSDNVFSNQSRSKLTHLYLDNNCFGDSGLLALADRHITVQEFWLNDNRFEGPGVIALFNRLRQCPTLCHLHIASCRFDETRLSLIVDSLADLLACHAGLKTVQLYDMSLIKKYEKQLNRALDKNSAKIKVYGIERVFNVTQTEMNSALSKFSLLYPRNASVTSQQKTSMDFDEKTEKNVSL